MQVSNKIMVRTPGRVQGEINPRGAHLDDVIELIVRGSGA
jgi:hypothetical protein